MAAGESSSSRPLFRNPANSGNSNLFKGEPAGVIQGKTIDSLDLPPIDVCKVDIEGAELLALQGMSETIARSPNMRLLIECSSQFRDSSELLAFLRTKFSSVRSVATGSPEIHGYCNVWAIR